MLFWRRKRLRELKRSMKWDRDGKRHWFIESHHAVQVGDQFYVSHGSEVVDRVGSLIDVFELVYEREQRRKRERIRTAGTITGQWCICNGTIHGAKDVGCRHADKPVKYYHKLQDRSIPDKIEQRFGDQLRRISNEGW